MNTEKILYNFYNFHNLKTQDILYGERFTRVALVVVLEGEIIKNRLENFSEISKDIDVLCSEFREVLVQQGKSVKFYSNNPYKIESMKRLAAELMLDESQFEIVTTHPIHVLRWDLITNPLNL